MSTTLIIAWWWWWGEWIWTYQKFDTTNYTNSNEDHIFDRGNNDDYYRHFHYYIEAIIFIQFSILFLCVCVCVCVSFNHHLFKRWSSFMMIATMMITSLSFLLVVLFLFLFGWIEKSCSIFRLLSILIHNHHQPMLGVQRFKCDNIRGSKKKKYIKKINYDSKWWWQFF